MTISNTQNTLLNQVINQLKAINEPVLLQAHNEYCGSLGYEDTIFYNDEDEINSSFDNAFEALRNLQHYNLSDDYFYFHNGNLISFSYLTSEDSPITFSELAQWIIDNDSYSEYDIEVTTIDDMLASIEDNINDDENMLYKLAEHLQESYDDDYTPDDVVLCCVVTLSNYDYEGLQEIITLLGINI